jgi:hypothetical protein
LDVKRQQQQPSIPHDESSRQPSLGLNLGAAEPSHIHIPRPSRRGRDRSVDGQELIALPAQLALEDAA